MSDVSNTACGADFTVWLTSVEGASIVYGLGMFSPSACTNVELLFDDFIR